jgi:hypothetical protein
MNRDLVLKNFLMFPSSFLCAQYEAWDEQRENGNFPGINSKAADEH